ncbi:MAG TPA: DNA primase [Rhabdochlamydiaceae bacterium]|nr:DNA primase [Rhabdochlamydiaceae bacterium]
MPLYTKESLDLLRQRIDLAEVISAHVDLKKAGSAYKALCPFHEEKTPSFIINRGDHHYHCFGCGAHGDAIAFLMNYLKMGFMEAVESLAEKFGVVLERDEKIEQTGPSKTILKEALQLACRFYHFMLLYSEEGHKALHYLYHRGIDLDFIRRFEVGFAPRQRNALYKFLGAKELPDVVLQTAGLLQISDEGQRRDFFSDRIMFPIRDGMGNVIGFSGRKFKEETFGGKYINTSETPLFKKSQLLYGLSYCRKTITKEKKALIVEGQIDCLRLIQAGFDFAVAGQGTAFGEGHVRELLNLGVQTVFLALDGDQAGVEAAVKIGDLFQKKGVEVFVITLPSGQDPDTLLRERGHEWFAKLLEKPVDYLTFLVGKLGKTLNLDSPSGKNTLTQQVVERVKAWEHPVMVHESLRKLAELVQVPEELIGTVQSFPVQREGHIKQEGIDGDKILETDLLRLLFLAGDKLFSIAKANLKPEQLKIASCRRLYEIFLKADQPLDLLTCAASLEKEDDSDIVLEIMSRKVQIEKAEESLISTIKRILQRNWMEEREAIKLKLHSGKLEEEEALELAKQFDALKKQVPEVVVP